MTMKTLKEPVEFATKAWLVFSMSRLECLICFGQSEAINSFLLVSFPPQINPHCGASLTFLRRQLKPVQFVVAVVVARAVKKVPELCSYFCFS